MRDPLDRLAARRDLFLASAKSLLIVATLLWLTGMALYDVSADRPGFADILLTTRTGYLLASSHVEPIDMRRIWGGPTTLFGLRCFAGTMGTVGLLALLRARLNHGGLSRLGLALSALALVAGALATNARGLGVYPTFVKPADFARLAAMIEAREPGLIARLRMGERLDLPATGGATVRLVYSPERGGMIMLPPPQGHLLRDRADAEGLRFALAQQAWIAGDRRALRRLLPIALSMPITDRPARYDIARRLIALGEAAGAAPTPEGNPFPVASYAARWRGRVRAILWLRHVMHLALLSGLVSLLIGLIIRRRHAAIREHAALLANRGAPRRRVQAAEVTPV